VAARDALSALQSTRRGKSAATAEGI
jgi:hypothetical protein